MFNTFFDWVVRRKTAGPSETAIGLFAQVVEQARRPEFYGAYGVPDTLDGRFDLLALNLFLVMRRLKRGGQEGRIVAQEMADLLVTSLDETLREMGVGDLSVGKRVKEMVRAFYGRVAAYDRALLLEDRDAMADAVRRNLYRDAPLSDAAVAAIAEYIVTNTARFEELRDARFIAEAIPFVAPGAVPA